jgi:tetratricopeptide (TPR) repeat protein
MQRKVVLTTCLFLVFYLVFGIGLFAQKKSKRKIKFQSKKIEKIYAKRDMPFDVDEVKAKAENCFKEKNYECSVEEYSRLIEEDFWDSSIYEHRGLSYLALSSDIDVIVNSVISNNISGSSDNAVRDFSSAIKLKPDSASLYCLRAIAYSVNSRLTRNQKDLMIKDLTKAITLSGDNPNYYKTRGYFYYYYKSEFAKAVTDLEKALSLNPNDDDIYYKLGEMHSTTLIENPNLNYEKAIGYYGKAVKLKPKEIRYYAARANVFEKVKKYKEAIDDYSTLIELQPVERYYQARGENYLISNNYESAVKDFTKAIELLDDFYYLYEKRGEAFLKLKLYEDALNDFDHIVKYGKSDACDGYKGRGDVFYSQNKYDQALENYSKAISSCDYNPKFYKLRADTYIKLGETDLAEKDLISIDKLNLKEKKYNEDLKERLDKKFNKSKPN